MKLWKAQQVLCRYNPKAVIHVQLPDGQVVVLDHLEDHYINRGGSCTCDFNRRDPEYDEGCPEHGDGTAYRTRCPLFVVKDP